MTKGKSARKFDPGTMTLAIFILSGPFFRGFLFESELMGAVMMVSLGLLLYLLRSRLPLSKLSQSKTTYLLLALTAMYAATIAYGDDRHEAVNSLLGTAMVLPLYLFALAATPQAMQRIWTAWVWLTGFSVPLGVALGRFVDGRLAGFIDYANGNAILLLIGIVMAMALSARGLPRAKWLQLPIFLCAAGIYLTESRTVLLLLVAALVLLYFWSRRSFPELWFRSCANAALGIAAAAAYVWSPLLIVLVAAVFALGYRLSDRLLSRRDLSLTRFAGVTALAIVVLCIGLGLADRWSTVVSRTGAGFTRLVYYRDAWSMVLDSPIWGYGAGAWSYMQYRYQTAAYFTAYVHSQPLQVMTEVGIAGFLIFAAACAHLVVRGFASAKRKDEAEARYDRFRMLACCALILHSLLDFSLSFPYMLGLLFILGASPEEPTPAANEAGRSFGLKTIACIVTIGTLILGTLLLVSDQLRQSAVRAIAEERKADAVRLLDRSASTALFSDRIHDRKARLYLHEYEAGQDRRYLAVARQENEKALSLQPEQIWYRKLDSDILWLQGEREEAVSILRELVRQNRFMTRWREELGRKEAQLNE